MLAEIQNWNVSYKNRERKNSISEERKKFQLTRKEKLK